MDNMYSFNSSSGDNSYSSSELDAQMFAKAEQMMKRLRDEQMSRPYHLMEPLISNSRVAYADQKKEFLIVRTKYFQQLESIVKQKKQSITRIQPEIKKLAMDSHLLNYFKKSEDTTTADILTQFQKLMQKYLSIEQSYSQLKQKHEQQSKNFQSFYEQFQSTKKQLKQSQAALLTYRNSIQIEEKEKFEIEIQTEFEVSDPKYYLTEEKKKESNHNLVEARVENNETDFQKVKNKFQEIINNLEHQIENKIQELRENIAKIENYQRENEHLREENERLQHKIYEIDGQERKLEVWRSSVQQFLEKTENQCQHEGQNEDEDEMMMEQEDDESFNEYAARERLRIMSNKVDELVKEMALRDRKQRQVYEIMRVLESEIGEEGIIENLVNLSSKVKECIKHMLSDI